VTQDPVSDGGLGVEIGLALFFVGLQALDHIGSGKTEDLQGK
jgi:hypothetical protein